MNMKTVGMISSYKNLTQADWLWKQAPLAFGQWKSTQVLAQHEKPDYLLLYQFNFPDYLNTPKRSWKTSLKRGDWRSLLSQKSQVDEAAKESVLKLFREVPKERIFFLVREPPLPEVASKQLANYQYAQDYCSYVSGPSESAPVPDYMPAIWYVNIDFQTLNHAPAPEKVRSCSWITSGINRTQNHQRRLQFLQSIIEAEIPVDVYGRGLSSWSNSLGSLENKWHGMAPYYYNLAIENYAENDLYVSEKLWDALLSWCLPIYYGGSAADKLLPPGSFLRLPSLDKKGIEYIKDVTSNTDAWYDAQQSIAEARQIILHKLNLLNWLHERIEKLENSL